MRDFGIYKSGDDWYKLQHFHNNCKKNNYINKEARQYFKNKEKQRNEVRNKFKQNRITDTKHIEERIIYYYQQGFNYSEIIKKTGFNLKTIQKILTKEFGEGYGR